MRSVCQVTVCVMMGTKVTARHVKISTNVLKRRMCVVAEGAATPKETSNAPVSTDTDPRHGSRSVLILTSVVNHSAICFAMEPVKYARIPKVDMLVSVSISLVLHYLRSSSYNSYNSDG